MKNVRTAELIKIETAVNNLPVFADYDGDRVREMSVLVFELFTQEDGLDALFWINSQWLA